MKPSMNSKIAVLYGPKGGNTEKIAKLIAKKIGHDKCDLIAVRDADETLLAPYNKLIIGGSTIGTHNWSHSNTSVDWDQFMPKFKKMNFAGKKVAIFGLGDHLAYTNHFVDEMFSLYQVLKNNGATIVGQWPTDGYEFNESAAIVNGKFVGLPIDEDHEDDLSEGRIDAWLNTLSAQM
ncbi:MAG TPA: flavodoxin [Marinilabiliales bacterium]|nr:flavodoxin [Marinilabiliales bacterium]HBO76180.1 flavodoxin [Marinilabiliales bacterium]HBX84386.1 flavodoxin [Marinilabiliales bacterium]HBY53404.1 flavodoxin [Marinilabiliales bacterium]